MLLVQILLPVDDRAASEGDARVARTRGELVERFGGITAYIQTPAIGEWTAPAGHREVDRVVMIEVVAPQFDRDWWTSYAHTLADRFEQDAVHVRALHVEMLDPRAA